MSSALPFIPFTKTLYLVELISWWDHCGLGQKYYFANNTKWTPDKNQQPPLLVHRLMDRVYNVSQR